MRKSILPKFLITFITSACFIFSFGVLFAQELKIESSVEKDLTELQSQARTYRAAGLEKQRIGNLVEAVGLYQKAIIVDPTYAVAYNDLGVVYEAMGSLDRALENYLKSLKIDPHYASVYTNLALFYENQRDLEKAAFYWNKRAQVGSLGDPWTQKAANRFKDVRLALSNQPISDQREEDVLGLMKDVTFNKPPINRVEKSQPQFQIHFQKAKDSFKKGDLATAIKEALNAQYLDQDNPEIEAFIEKTTLRALSK